MYHSPDLLQIPFLPFLFVTLQINCRLGFSNRMFRALASILLCCFFLHASFWFHVSYGNLITCSGIVPMRYRNDKISIADFGGVGDGKTLNTKSFREAIFRIQHLRRRGGTLLYVPPGVYLTDSFNLTSHMTLYLARGAVIKATQVTQIFSVLSNTY